MSAPSGTPYIMPDGPGGRKYTLTERGGSGELAALRRAALRHLRASRMRPHAPACAPPPPSAPAPTPRMLPHPPSGKPSKGKGARGRGKDEVMAALHARMGGSSLEDLAELHAIERAGWRRRNRW